MSNSALIKSSIAKKVWMALTGLFLCLFLVGHLAGNLQLIFAGPAQFNAYGDFMHHNIAIQILAKLTAISIIFHAIDGLVLTIQNRRARPVKYQHEKPGANSIWSSRNMGVLGTIILVFIATHMENFWYPFYYQRSEMPQFTTKLGEQIPDLHKLVFSTFSPDQPYGLALVIFYLFAMAALGFHLWHGFQSGFQSLGLRPENPSFIKGLGKAFAVIVPLLFAIIPLYVYLAQ